MNFREIRGTMREAVHQTMGVSALYLESPGSTPIPCRVRVHDKNALHGGLQGTNFHYPEREDIDVMLRFKLSEIETPRRGAIVSIAVGEAYQIDRREENDFDYVYCPALRLRAEDAAGLPVPEA